MIDADITVITPNDNYERTSVDENGYYYFDSFKSYGQCRLWVISGEYVGLSSTRDNELTINFSENSKYIQHIELEKACMLEVEATNEEGNRITEINVTVCDPSIETSHWLNSTSKDRRERGKTIVSGIKPSLNTRIVRISGCESQITKNKNYRVKKQYAATYRSIVLNDSEVIENIQVVLKEGITINGRLLYANGEPANGFTVYVISTYWPYKYRDGFEVNENGTFLVNNIESGDYNIVAVKSHRHESFPVQNIQKDDYLNLALPFSSPDKGCAFSGKIIIDGDCDIDSIKISGHDAKQYFSQSIDIYNGQKEVKFELTGIEPDTYNLHLSGTNLKYAIVRNVSIPNENFIQTVECYKTVSITATIIDNNTATPIDNFRVWPHRITKDNDIMRVARDWITYTQSNGKFEYKARDDYNYIFIIDSKGYAPQTIEFDASQCTSFTAKLTKGATVKGKVVDSDGTPIENAKLIPFTKNGKYDMGGKEFVSDNTFVTSDQTGSFTLKNLPLGSETIKISHPSYPEKIIDIDLPELNNNTIITLDSGGTVEGYVYDNCGNVRVGFPLVAERYGFDNCRFSLGLIKTTTDSKGYYKFKNLPEEFLYIKHPTCEKASGNSRNGILPIANETLELNLGGTYFLTGKLFHNGSPLSNTKIRVIESENYDQSPFLSIGHTESDGSFLFSGITSGKKKLIYKSPDSKYGFSIITEFDTKGLDFNLGDVFIQSVDLEISVEASTDINMAHCFLIENNESPMRYNPTYTPDNTLIFENVKCGEYSLLIRLDNAIIAQKIEVLPESHKVVTNVVLPALNSSIHGRIVMQEKSLCCQNIDSGYVVYLKGDNDGKYDIDKMPPGNYSIKSEINGMLLTTFELRENEKLELNLDELNLSEEQLTTSYLKVVDSNRRRFVNNYTAYLEAGNTKYENISQYEIKAYPGTYTLCINSDGYKEHRQTIELSYTGSSYDSNIPTIIAVLERE